MNEMSEFHMAKGDGLFLSGTSLMIYSAMVLVTVLIAWTGGGSEFKDSIYGDQAIVASGIGFIVGAYLDYLAKETRKRH